MKRGALPNEWKQRVGSMVRMLVPCVICLSFASCGPVADRTGEPIELSPRDAVAPRSSAPGVQLPPDALREKARLAFLFEEITERYPCEVRDQVNEMIPRVHSLTWARDPGEIDGEMRIPVPPDVVRVWKLFDSLSLYGTGLGEPGQEIRFETPGGEHRFPYWRDEDRMLSGHANKMPTLDETHEGYTTVVAGRGRIDRIALESQYGVSARFDINPWSTLGRDKPIRPVAVTVDATHRRAIAGSVRLEREKFWRIPSHYGNHPEGLGPSRYAAERGFLPGRHIWKLDALVTWGYGGVMLREDPANPGKPDYAAFDGLELDEEWKRVVDEAFPDDFEMANCFDNWPPFMALKGTRIKNDRGTPADFHEAARLAAAAIGWRKIVEGRCERWWEVKNEATIGSEWVLHGEDGVDSWGELARFHNTMADTIHARHPELLVGGPASAWMALHHKDFELARRQLRFMDETRGHLDFYSHHFYEGKDLIHSEGAAYSGGYLLGRLEGCLDLLRNHMELTGNVKPMLITETGTLTDRNTEMGVWLNAKNMSSYLVRYMNHADKIDLVSLWLIPYAWWSPDDRLLFVRDGEGPLVLNEKVGYFLEQWKDYRGDRLPNRVETPGTDVHLHSVIDGRTVWVAINNLNPYRIAVDLSLMAGDAKPVQVEQIRHYFEGGEIHYETVRRESPAALPVAVEETSLVRLTLDRVPASAGTLNERTFYGDRVLQPTGKAVTFNVDCPATPVDRARLRICLSRDEGFEEKATVRVNGHTVADGLVITPERKPGNYWGYLDIDVPPDRVRAGNTVTVSVPEDGGTITSVALVAAVLE